jgi:hypothetical protein
MSGAFADIGDLPRSPLREPYHLFRAALQTSCICEKDIHGEKFGRT